MSTLLLHLLHYFLYVYLVEIKKNGHSQTWRALDCSYFNKIPYIFKINVSHVNICFTKKFGSRFWFLSLWNVEKYCKHSKYAHSRRVFLCLIGHCFRYVVKDQDHKLLKSSIVLVCDWVKDFCSSYPLFIDLCGRSENSHNFDSSGDSW